MDWTAIKFEITSEDDPRRVSRCPFRSHGESYPDGPDPDRCTLLGDCRQCPCEYGKDHECPLVSGPVMVSFA